MTEVSAEEAFRRKGDRASRSCFARHLEASSFSFRVLSYEEPLDALESVHRLFAERGHPTSRSSGVATS